MAVKRIARGKWIGLSTDTKPAQASADVPIGATFFEYNTGRLFVTPDGDNWTIKSSESGFLVANTTIDLDQVAGNYDLFEVDASSIKVLQFGLIVPADLTGAAAGALTAISVQSTDATPVEFISATDGAKVNLSANKHLIYNGQDVVAITKKIQLTIVGGATTAAQVCSIWMAYIEVST